MARCSSSGDDLSSRGDEDTASVGAPTSHWYPVDSMELDAVLAQELGLFSASPEAAAAAASLALGFVAAAASASAVASPKSGSGTSGRRGKCGLFVDAGHSPHAGGFTYKTTASETMMSLRNFLNEDVPAFPFSRRAAHTSLYQRA